MADSAPDRWSGAVPRGPAVGCRASAVALGPPCRGSAVALGLARRGVAVGVGGVGRVRRWFNGRAGRRVTLGAALLLVTLAGISAGLAVAGTTRQPVGPFEARFSAGAVVHRRHGGRAAAARLPRTCAATAGQPTSRSIWPRWTPTVPGAVPPTRRGGPGQRQRGGRHHPGRDPAGPTGDRRRPAGCDGARRDRLPVDAPGGGLRWHRAGRDGDLASPWVCGRSARNRSPSRPTRVC